MTTKKLIRFIGAANRILTPKNTLESIILLPKYVVFWNFALCSFSDYLAEDKYCFYVFTVFEKVQWQESHFYFDLFVAHLQWLL